jgi:hypothetical protein
MMKVMRRFLFDGLLDDFGCSTSRTARIVAHVAHHPAAVHLVSLQLRW